jgi:cytochrome c5
MEAVSLGGNMNAAKKLSLGWLVLGVFFYSNLFAFENLDVDWGRDFPIPKKGNSNPYQLEEQEFYESLHRGTIDTLVWPVEVTGILLPYSPIAKFIDGRNESPFRRWLSSMFTNFSKVDNMHDLYDWMGLNTYPKKVGDIDSPYYVPTPPNQARTIPMGLGFIERNGARGFTFSCATCHSSNLFGKKVIGLSNRFMRANSIFVKGKKAAKHAHDWLFHLSTGATKAEREMFQEMRENIKFVGVKDPVALGLDTSLAQVSLSLARRAKDPYATKEERFARKPRKEKLSRFVADSKPATWWTLKYKNRWLSDGSVVSGNPILTNLLWNEIGRGTDLEVLEQWLDNNFETIKDLTTASFSTEPPPITDFMEFSLEDLEMAKRGEVIFENTCAKCHGHYLKVWNYPGSHMFKVKDQIKTLMVDYPQPTKVKNVGTDPNRWMGMKSLEQLNDLSISKRFNIVIEPQEGYVPPPLVGIWARWPYFHNNSIPNLCALLTPAAKRPKSFWMGEAIDPQRDYDFECNGYPLYDKTPKHWQEQGPMYFYQTSKEGMSNSGHSKMLIDKETGKEKFSRSDKLALIKYLQTL